MWLKRWSNPSKTADGQVAGNHAVGFVQVERDTIGLWLLFNSELCLGLPDFTLDMVYTQNDGSVSTERKQRRAKWWMAIDEKILASDVAGFQLGWRTFSHMHKMLPGSTPQTILQNYAGDSSARSRTKAQIVQGWRDTDACLRALFSLSPYRFKSDNGFALANRMLAGAFFFAKPDGNIVGAFPGATSADAQKLSGVYAKFLKGASYDQLLNDQGKLAALREDLKSALSFAEAA